MGPVGKLSLFNHVDQLSPFAPPVGERSSVDPARGPPGGTNSSDRDGIYGQR